MDTAITSPEIEIGFSDVLFPRRFISEYLEGNDELAVPYFGFASLDDLYSAMQFKAARVATTYGLTVDELVAQYPNTYL